VTPEIWARGTIKLHRILWKKTLRRPHLHHVMGAERATRYKLLSQRGATGCQNRTPKSNKRRNITALDNSKDDKQRSHSEFC